MLHPCFRLRYFDESWKGPLARYLAPMKKRLRALYDSEYKILPAEQQQEVEKDIFDTYMDNLLPTKASDPYKELSKSAKK
jgi:hypothetical protein